MAIEIIELTKSVIVEEIAGNISLALIFFFIFIVLCLTFIRISKWGLLTIPLPTLLALAGSGAIPKWASAIVWIFLGIFWAGSMFIMTKTQ